MKKKIIDSHVHFWNYNPRDPEFSWIDDSMGILKNNYPPFHHPYFEAQTKSSNNTCIAVQAKQSLEETFFLLELSNKFTFIEGVVGWIDFKSNELPKLLEQLKEHKKLKGFRHIIQAEKSGFMSNLIFESSIKALNGYYTYDLLIKPQQLREAVNLVRKFPEQKFVIDHLAKPDFKNKNFNQWLEDVEQFRNLTNCYCKLSGMVTEAEWKNWRNEDFFFALNKTIEVFGEDRLMFGSDWPVCLLAGSFEQVFDIMSQFLDNYSQETGDKIRYKNAVKFYNI